MNEWITLSSGIRYFVRGRGRPRTRLLSAVEVDVRRRSARQTADDLRAERMADLYKSGLTLAQVGFRFGVTRERVRQILKSIGKDKTRAKPEPKASAARNAARIRIAEKWGVTYERWKSLRADGTVVRFERQRNAARGRGIPWELTFAQWLGVWESSGKIGERGRGKDKFCMARIGDVGAYSVDNVIIKTHSENCREARANENERGRKWSDVQGVTHAYPGRPNKAWMAKYGRKAIGYFSTKEEAVEARLSYEREHGVSGSGFGRGKGWTFVKKMKSRPYMMQVAGAKSQYFATQEEAEAAYKRIVAELKAKHV